MAIASRFQPRNLAESRFNPFYGEMPEIPWGPGIQRRTTRVQNGTPMFVPKQPMQDPDWIPPAPDPNLQDYPDPFLDFPPSWMKDPGFYF